MFFFEKAFLNQNLILKKEYKNLFEVRLRVFNLAFQKINNKSKLLKKIRIKNLVLGTRS